MSSYNFANTYNQHTLCLMFELQILFCFTTAVEVCFTEENYTVYETDGFVAINLRVTGKYFVFMNATVSCKSGSAIASENAIDETMYVRM